MLNQLRRAGRVTFIAACLSGICWLNAATAQDQPAGPVIRKTIIINPDGSTTTVDGDASGIKPAIAPTTQGQIKADSATSVPATGHTLDSTPATRPAGPAFHVGRTQVQVSPEAQKELDQLKKAYAALSALDVSGTVSWKAEINGKKENASLTLTSSYQSPNKFRSEVKDDVTIGATGEKVYVAKANEYLTLDQPKEKLTLENLPGPVGPLVMAQSPALVMILSQDPIEVILQGVDQVKKTDDVTIEGGKFIALSLSGEDRDEIVLIDPRTHLLRRIEMDQRKELQKNGVENVTSATTTLEYTATTVNPTTQPGAKDVFAWTAPAGAKDMTAMLMGDAEEFAASALTGQAAPDFTLAGLDGKEVSIAKGKVVVVDFWATWCGPCRASMPHLNRLYKDNMASGLVMIGVSVDQDTSLVAPFVKEMDLKFTVVIDDPQGTVAKKYSVDHYPTTFVIGKNGKVLKVLVGNSPETAEELEKVVSAAMKMPGPHTAVPATKKADSTTAPASAPTSSPVR